MPTVQSAEAWEDPVSMVHEWQASLLVQVSYAMDACSMLLNLQNKAAAPETQAEETVVNIVKPKHNQMDSQGSDSRMAIVV